MKRTRAVQVVSGNGQLKASFALVCPRAALLLRERCSFTITGLFGQTVAIGIYLFEKQNGIIVFLHGNKPKIHY